MNEPFHAYDIRSVYGAGIDVPVAYRIGRALARRLAEEKGIMDHTRRTLFLMRGGDPSGRNDFRLRW